MTGAAGLIWRACPDCSREDVTECLLTTAEDSGTPGKDIYYGEGILNTKAAFVCMAARPCCDYPRAEEIFESEAPSMTPLENPTSAPSNLPSVVPSSPPSNGPTSAPTLAPSIAPTGAPSVAPTSIPSPWLSAGPTFLPSSSPSRDPQCENMCQDKEQFCMYKAQKHCAVEKGKCIATCQTAVTDRAIDAGVREVCQNVWCLAETESCLEGREASCKTEHTMCQTQCLGTT